MVSFFYAFISGKLVPHYVVSWRNSLRSPGRTITYGLSISAQIANVSLQDRAVEYAYICFPSFWFLGTYLRMAKVWEIEQKKLRAMFKGHRGDVFSLAFSPDGRCLVSGSYDNSVRIWRLRDGLSWELLDNALEYFSVCFSPDGRYIAAANSDKNLRIWRARTGELVDKWSAHTEAVMSVAFAPDGKRLLSGSADQTIRCWDVDSLEIPQPASSEASPKAKEIFTLKGHTVSVH